MIGSRNGVAAKLKEIVPWLVNNHCVVHMLALTCSQAADRCNSIHEEIEKYCFPNASILTTHQSGR